MTQILQPLNNTRLNLGARTCVLACMMSLSNSCSNQSENHQHSNTSDILSPVPIVTLVGHGAFFDTSNTQIDPSVEIVLATQKTLLKKWSGRVGEDITFEPTSVSKNHERLERLFEAAKKQGLREFASDQQVSLALWSFYRKTVPDSTHTQTKHQTLETNASGADYIAQCRGLGVPVPNSVLSGEWTNHGTINQPFVSTEYEAEVWSWESEDPDGICVALPRWSSIDNTAILFGIICLGRQTNKVCYFDNPTNNTSLPAFYAARNAAPYPIDKFIGGADLEGNGGGICTDCHAGANPYIIHPEEPAFINLKAESKSISPIGWPEPIVEPTWVQNPGPLGAFPPTPAGQQSCESCHSSGRVGGQLPIPSRALNGYCSILNSATKENSPVRTMPPGGGDPTKFESHVTYLKKLCRGEIVYENNDIGTVVTNPPNDETSFLSKPVIFGPLYACTNRVNVRGARLGSTVDVFVQPSGGVPSLAVTATIANPDGQDLTVPTLNEGDVVWATQTIGNTTSSLSNTVLVRSHTIDYPLGLPEPTIESIKVHECGQRVAVNHVPGATLHVVTNANLTNSSQGHARGVTPAFASAPFQIGDNVQVYQEICTEQSQPSNSVVVLTAPTTLPPLTTTPPEIYEGQEMVTVTSIVESASIQTTLSSAGTIPGVTSWPWTAIRQKIYSGFSFSPTNNASIQQTLCAFSSTPVLLEANKECEDLPAPSITPPIVGDEYIIVSSAVPGATLRIYDESNVEIGDGAGNLIMLSRPLVGGESIIVVQQLGQECVADVGIELVVQD